MTSSLKTTTSNGNHATRGIQDRLFAAIEQLKTRLQARYEQRLPGNTGQIREILRAAEAAARETPFPHLFLPELADEGIARLIATRSPSFANKDAANACLACAA